MKIGFIGTNFVSDWMAEAVKSEGSFTLHSIYSRKRDTGAAFAQRHGFNHVFCNLEEFFSSGIDAVYIATPNSLHCSQSILAIEHGLHVLCEKPVASNLQEFELMQQKAEEKGVILLEAMRPAFDPMLEIVKENLPRIGAIRRAVFEFCQYSSRYDRFRAGEIMNAFNPALSNAAIMDIGVYCVHSAIHLFGEPDSIYAKCSHLHNGMESSGVALFDYNDFQAEIVYSKVSASINESLIQGEDGTITMNKLSDPKVITLYPRGKEPEIIPYFPEENNMVYILKCFRSLIEKKEVKSQYTHFSRLEMKAIDEIRRQTGTVFPADNN